MRDWIRWITPLVLALLVACPAGDDDDDAVDDDTGDDDTADDDTGDDDTADDDTADDDTADDDSAGDDDTTDPEPRWPSWQGVTVDDANASLVGEATGDWAGSSVTSVGDMDGDGIDDLVIGARGVDEGGADAGKVYFVSGRAKGWSFQEPLAPYPSLVGDAEDMELGYLSTALGDVNGDGLADVALTPRLDTDPAVGEYLVLGRSSGWPQSAPLTANADASVTDANHAGTGTVTRPDAGDVDGDGQDDWLMGSYGSYGLRGQAHIVSGASAAPGLVAPADAAGWIYGQVDERLVVRSLGDLSGDQTSELIAYGYNALDEAYLLQGGAPLPHDAEMLTVADAVFSGEGTYELQSLASVGDVDGDGIGDLGVVFRDINLGPYSGFHLFTGRTTWTGTLTGADSATQIFPGEFIIPGHAVGDLNGDGIDDLLVLPCGTKPNLFNCPAVLFFGRAKWPSQLTLADADVVIQPEPSIGGLAPFPDSWHRGDLDGDGIDDLLLWAIYIFQKTPVDKVYIFAGREVWPSTVDATQASGTFLPSVPHQSLAMDERSCVTDVNGDGMDDYLTSSPDHPPGTEEGETFVFFGHPRKP